MRYLPLFVDSSTLQVLVVGGGNVAARKLAMLSKTKAQLTVIAPFLVPELERLKQRQGFVWHQRLADVTDIATCWDLIYLATDDDAIQQTLAQEAMARGIWVNAVDRPELCRFITPAVLERGRFQLAITTAGCAPVLSGQLRSQLEVLLPHSLTPLLDFVADKRSDIRQQFPDPRQRRLFWQYFFQLNGSRFDDATAAYFQQSLNFQRCQTSDNTCPLINPSTPYQLPVEPKTQVKQGMDVVGQVFLLDCTIDYQLLPLGLISQWQHLDTVCCDGVLPAALDDLLRRDADRQPLPDIAALQSAVENGRYYLLYADKDKLLQYQHHLPDARFILPGSY